MKRAVGTPVRAYKTAKKGLTTAIDTTRNEIYYNGGIRGTVDKYSNTAKSFVAKKARLVGASAKKQLARQNDAMHMGYTFNRK